MELLFPLILVALFVPMYLGIRRQKKELRRTTELQDSLSVGDRVSTTSGLHATIAALGDSTLDLEIAPGVVTTWSRLAVRELVDQDLDADDEDPADDADSPSADATTTKSTDAPDNAPNRLTKD